VAVGPQSPKKLLPFDNASDTTLELRTYTANNDVSLFHGHLVTASAPHGSAGYTPTFAKIAALFSGEIFNQYSFAFALISIIHLPKLRGELKLFFFL